MSSKYVVWTKSNEHEQSINGFIFTFFDLTSSESLALHSTCYKFNEGQSARFSLTTLTSSLLKFATPGQEGNVQTSSRAAVDWIESECAFTLETTKDALPPSLRWCLHSHHLQNCCQKLLPSSSSSKYLPNYAQKYVREWGCTMRRKILNWCNLVSISKKLMFYVLGVVRIY